MSKAPQGQPVQDPLEDYDPGYSPQEQRPFNPIEVEAERSILATLLVTPAVFADVCDQLSPSTFGSPAHEAIYAAIESCEAAGKPFDTVTLANEMARLGTAWAIRGDYLRGLVTEVPRLESLDSHVEIVNDRALRRRMRTAAVAINQAAADPQIDAMDALEVAEQQVFELGQRRADPSMASMAQVMDVTLAAIKKSASGQLAGQPTGIRRLDELTRGLGPGQLVVIAARPAMGKSVLALQIAYNIARATRLDCPYFSYEMSHEELGLRLLAAESGIPMNDILRGKYASDPGMDRALSQAVMDYTASSLKIDDKPPLTVSGIRSTCKRMARRGKLGVIAVDYMQLVSGEGKRSSENRTQEVSYISRTLKLLAQELEVPVIAVSQLSRAPEMRTNKRPVLSDLRESGSIEQDANLVLGLYRDWVYDKSADEHAAELLVIKNRQGPLDEIPVEFQGALARFRNSDRQIVRAPGGFAGGARDLF